LHIKSERYLRAKVKLEGIVSISISLLPVKSKDDDAKIDLDLYIIEYPGPIELHEYIHNWLKCGPIKSNDLKFI